MELLDGAWFWLGAAGGAGVKTRQQLCLAVVCLWVLAVPWFVHAQTPGVAAQPDARAGERVSETQGFSAGNLAAKVMTSVRDGERLDVLVVRTPTGSFEVDLSELLGGQVQLVRPVAGQRIAVLREVGRSSTQVLLIDVAQRAVVKTFLSWGATISPDGRWILFKQFFTPAPGPDNSYAGCWRLLDVARVKSSAVGPDDLFEVPLSDRLFPHRRKADSGACPDQPDDATWVSYNEGAAEWSEDSRRFVFAVGHGKQAVLVWGTLASSPTATWRVFHRTIGAAGDQRCLNTCGIFRARVSAWEPDRIVVAVSIGRDRGAWLGEELIRTPR